MDKEDGHPAGSTMTLVDLKELIAESKFQCNACGDNIQNESGPYAISVDWIHNGVKSDKPHSKGNCRIVQRRLNTTRFFSHEVYRNIFVFHEILNHQLHNLAKSTRNHHKLLHNRSYQLAVDANNKNEELEKYYNEEKAPLVTMEMIEKNIFVKDLFDIIRMFFY